MGKPNLRPSPRQRLQTSAIRAMDAHTDVQRAAKRVTEEMDEITSPSGIPLVDLDDEDSMVIAIAAVKEAVQK